MLSVSMQASCRAKRAQAYSNKVGEGAQDEFFAEAPSSSFDWQLAPVTDAAEADAAPAEPGLVPAAGDAEVPPLTTNCTDQQKNL